MATFNLGRAASDTDCPGDVGEDAVIRHLRGLLDRESRHFDHLDPTRVQLRLCAEICEAIAFARAGDWTATRVGDLLVLAAQIERMVSAEPTA